MKIRNVGSTDKIIRLGIAVLISILYFAHQINGATAVILLTLAGVLILTSSISFCPLYYPFKFSTRGKGE